MKRQPAVTIVNSLPRCAHTTPSGRHCRGSASSPDSPFCPRHLPKEDPASALVRDLDQFRSASDVTVFLSRLISALSKDQISTRRAAVLSYVSISLMHALRTLHQEHERSTNSSGEPFDVLPPMWDMPRPWSKGYANIHDARALYAQQYADEMRKIAQESLSREGLASYFYPYDEGCTLRDGPPIIPPPPRDPEELPVVGTPRP